MAETDEDLDSVLDAYWSSLDSKHSRRGYKHDWELFVEWLADEELGALEARPSDVQRYVAHMHDAEKAKSTRARALSVIRAVYDYLTVNDLLDSNPARSVKNVKTSGAPKTPWLDEQAARRLFEAVAEDADGGWRERRNRLCLLLFLGTGWRRSEVARMRVEDFKGEVVTGRVKGNKEATAPVPAWLRKEIALWCEYAGIGNVGPLLPKIRGSVQSVSQELAYRIVKRAAERAGFKPNEVTPHGLRRTLITLSGMRGSSLKDRQTAVAHSSSHTTERYDHAIGTSAPGELLSDLIYGKR